MTHHEKKFKFVTLSFFLKHEDEITITICTKTDKKKQNIHNIY